MCDGDRQDKGADIQPGVTLDGFDKAVRMTRGIFIKDIPADTILEIRAGKDVFTLLVTVPTERKLKIRGSEYLPELMDGVLQGSTFGSPMLKQGYIGVGMCMEVWVSGVGTLTTGTVERISIVVNGTTAVQ